LRPIAAGCDVLDVEAAAIDTAVEFDPSTIRTDRSVIRRSDIYNFLQWINKKNSNLC